MTHASLAFLSYNRPAFIQQAVMSAVQMADYPLEVIVHDDGSSDPRVQSVLLDLLAKGFVSHLILNTTGHNEGVGTAINRCFKLAAGDYLVKLDQDLVFRPGWLRSAIQILETDSDVGMVGLFKYATDPVDWVKMEIPWPEGRGPARNAPPYHYVHDFVGSAMVIRAEDYRELGGFPEHSDAFAEDVEFKKRMQNEMDYELALPDNDLATNQGFGPGPSTVVRLDGPDIKVTEIHHGPHIIGRPSLAVAKDRDFRVGIVITTAAGRERNLQRVLECVNALDPRLPEGVVVVYDGHVPSSDETPGLRAPYVRAVAIEKHQPGHEQPRNVGFEWLTGEFDVTHVWFLDSDLVFEPETLLRLYEGHCAAPLDRILIAPYDWLPQGQERPLHGLRNDPRWASFNEHGPEVVFGGSDLEPLTDDDLEWARRRERGENVGHEVPVSVQQRCRLLGPALACFGGNLVWPVKPFRQIGGFHPMLHHGRCEDGELGLRAASCGVPMSFVAEARAWHVEHPRDNNAAVEKNTRDVPLLNSWHPWVQEAGLVLNTEQDGVRFDFCCPSCGEQINSLAYWQHMEGHK